MKLAVMQPYLFPYLGYFQLIQAVDRFVLYDDVPFIKQGWVNRNRILVNRQPRYFTVPVRHASSFRGIRETAIDDVGYAPWMKAFLKTLDQNYGKARFLDAVRGLVLSVMESPPTGVGDLAGASIKAVMLYLGMDTRIVPTSADYANTALRGQARILDICAQEGATHYVNASGGRDLYDPDAFAAQGISLSFLVPKLPEYPQRAKVFVPGLSILDVLMQNSPETVRGLLSCWSLDRPRSRKTDAS